MSYSNLLRQATADDSRQQHQEQLPQQRQQELIMVGLPSATIEAEAQQRQQELIAAAMNQNNNNTDHVSPGPTSLSRPQQDHQDSSLVATAVAAQHHRQQLIAASVSSSGGMVMPHQQQQQQQQLTNLLQHSTGDDPGWEEQFNNLREYQSRVGHCSVPARFKPNPRLGHWVMTQRRQHTFLIQGRPSALTEDRIRRLEALGFTWSVRPKPNTSWSMRYKELQAFKSRQGNCLVPQRYQANMQLGTWVHTQRRHYKLWLEGKKNKHD